GRRAEPLSLVLLLPPRSQRLRHHPVLRLLAGPWWCRDRLHGGDAADQRPPERFCRAAATRQDRDVDVDGGTHRVEVALLGELRVRRDGVPVEVPGSRLRGLLALLALNAGRPVDAAS